MARKRGGLAGFWDRNKAWLKPIATAAGTLVAGPVGGAVVGGAIGGLDRPGKGGIGFDVGRGALGAATGYVGGKMMEGGAGALKGLFAPKAAPAVGSVLSKGGTTLLPGTLSAGEKIASAGGAMQGSFLKDLFSPQAIGGIAQGTLGAIQGGQRNALERQRMAQEREQFGQTFGLQQQRFGEEQRLSQLDEERRRKVASLMALFAPQLLRGAGIGGQPMAQG